jgi:DICT domain-containing protein
VQSLELASKIASVVPVGIAFSSQLVAVPHAVFGAVLAENVIVASPIPVANVNVPFAVGAPVPKQ